MTTTAPKPPAAFWIVSVLALLWNLMGVLQFSMMMVMSPDMLAALPPEQQELYTNVPLWANIAFGVAVFGSELGCILMLMRRSLAVPVFNIAFAAILVQMVHSLAISKSIEVYGPGGLVMPVLIILIGAFLIWYSRKARAMGWLR
jgi:hypothetical protein